MSDPHGACGWRLVVIVSIRLGRRLALLLSLCSFVAAAQDTVVVSASREPAARNTLAADVVVIDAARIAASGADSLEDLLRREAGLQLLRNGAPGQSAGLSIRGGATGQTLLLVDGVRVGSATLGQPEFDLLALAGIERIEVLRGPGSTLYGADALGGVVQVFTRRGQGAPQVSLRAAAGGYGAREGSAAAGAGFGALDVAASLAGERSRGVSVLRPGDAFGNFNPDLDGHSRRQAALKAGYTFAPGQRLGFTLRESEVDARYDGSVFGGPPDFLQDSSPDFSSRGVSRQTALDGRFALGPTVQLSALLSRDSSDRRFGASEPERYRTERDQARLQASWQVQPGQQLSLALERLGESVQSTGYAPAARDNDAFVLAWAGAAGPARVQAEARRDRNSAYGASDTGRVGLRWPLGPALALRALVGTSFRAPSFNDLLFPNYGVPTIRPERARSAELGLDAQLAGAEIALTVWQQRQRDLIAYEPDVARCPPGGNYRFGCARNVQSARLQGASLAAHTSWQGFTLRAGLELLDTEDEATGARLPRRAAHQETLALQWRGGAFSAGAELLHVGARPDSGVVLPAETTLDVQAAWRPAPGWQLQLKLNNATDRDLQPLRDYQGLGRQAWLVLRWDGGL
jgi:vitamin B12 transporter